MTDRKIDKAFLGIGWSFPPEFYKHPVTPGVKMIVEEDDIRESLSILLTTTPGERVMQPAYGCGLNALVFDVITESLITEIKDVIERSVLFFETRITLQSVDVNTDDSINGQLKIQLNYTVRKTNTRSNIVYPFYYLEGNLVRI